MQLTLLSEQIVKWDLVVRTDSFAQIIEQFDHRKCLGRRPVIGEHECNATLATGRQVPGLHGFAFLRFDARSAERSFASFRR